MMQWLIGRHKTQLPKPEEALPGRAERMPVPERHLVLGTPLTPPYPEGTEIAKYHETVANAKKQVILRAVEQAGGSYTEAAKLLGVHPNYLHRLIRNMNLKSALKTVG